MFVKELNEEISCVVKCDAHNGIIIPFIQYIYAIELDSLYIKVLAPQHKLKLRYLEIISFYSLRLDVEYF